MDLAAFREANRRRVKNLHAAMQVLYESVCGSRHLPRVGHPHGRPPRPDRRRARPRLSAGRWPASRSRTSASRPRPWSRSWTSPRRADAAKVAEALLAETLTDPGVVEVGHHDGSRWTITLEEQPAADGQPGPDPRQGHGLRGHRRRRRHHQRDRGRPGRGERRDLRPARPGARAGPRRPEDRPHPPGPRAAQARPHRRGAGEGREADAGDDRPADHGASSGATRRSAPSRRSRRPGARPSGAAPTSSTARP